MIISEIYTITKKGTKLLRYLDAKVDEYNHPLRDDNGHLIPTGYYMLQNETGIEYAEAIDLESAPYTYSETTHAISKEAKRI